MATVSPGWTAFSHLAAQSSSFLQLERQIKIYNKQVMFSGLMV